MSARACADADADAQRVGQVAVLVGGAEEVAEERMRGEGAVASGDAVLSTERGGDDRCRMAGGVQGDDADPVTVGAECRERVDAWIPRRDGRGDSR